MNVLERYGPWADIADASEGTARAYARQVTAQGINCVLIARCEGLLLSLADTGYALLSASYRRKRVLAIEAASAHVLGEARV